MSGSRMTEVGYRRMSMLSWISLGKEGFTEPKDLMRDDSWVGKYVWDDTPCGISMCSGRNRVEKIVIVVGAFGATPLFQIKFIFVVRRVGDGSLCGLCAVGNLDKEGRL